MKQKDNQTGLMILGIAGIGLYLMSQQKEKAKAALPEDMVPQKDAPVSAGYPPYDAPDGTKWYFSEDDNKWILVVMENDKPTSKIVPDKPTETPPGSEGVVLTPEGEWEYTFPEGSEPLLNITTKIIPDFGTPESRHIFAIKVQNIGNNIAKNTRAWIRLSDFHLGWFLDQIEEPVIKDTWARNANNVFINSTVGIDILPEDVVVLFGAFKLPRHTFFDPDYPDTLSLSGEVLYSDKVEQIGEAELWLGGLKWTHDVLTVYPEPLDVDDSYPRWTGTQAQRDEVSTYLTKEKMDIWMKDAWNRVVATLNSNEMVAYNSYLGYHKVLKSIPSEY